MLRYLFILPLVALFYYTGCSPEVEIGSPDPEDDPALQEWTIPKTEILGRGDVYGDVSTLDEPSAIYASVANYLSDDDMVLGFKADNDFRAYPKKILNYHEAVNDKIGIYKVLITYCPFSGTGLAWNREIDGKEIDFGVSNYIYNSNHILVDIESKSHWQQMLSECVNGSYIRTDAENLQVIETTWGNWVSMFPGSKVLTDATGFEYNYDTNPFQDYEISSDLLFDINNEDKRLSLKEKVYGIVVNERARIYRFTDFDQDISMISDNFQGLSIVLVGSAERNFIVSFSKEIENGTELDFTINNSAPNIILEDNEGNIWDVFGLAVSGPRKGQSLTHTNSYMGFWFAWSAMYEDALIYE